MIAKISTGSCVTGMVNYNHSKISQTKNEEQKGIILGTNNINSEELNAIVNAISNANSRNNNVSKPNIHISLSFHKDDILDNETIYKIAEDYMKDLGYSNQPYAVYRHFDKEHPHIHLVSSTISVEGKKINDSHIKRRSCKISRELEEKYQITKAVDKNEIFGKKDLSKAINEHLEEGKHSLSAIMKRILADVLEKKPTDESQFDKMLKEFQLIRTIVCDEKGKQKGNYFDLRPIEFIEEKIEYVKESHKIQGSELDPNYGFINIQNTLLNNKAEKEKLLRNMMGRVYFVINPVFKNAQLSLKPEKLSELIIQFKRKGIDLKLKRSQTGENPNTIYALLFKDIREGHIYTATDLRIKTKDFLVTIDDDLKNLPSKAINDLLSEKNDEKSAISFPKNEDHTYENHLSVFDNLLSLFSTPSPTNQESKVPVKKRKRKRNL